MLRCSVKAIMFIKGIGVYRYLILITAQYSKVPILAVIMDLIKRISDASRAHLPKANANTGISRHSGLIMDSVNIPKLVPKNITRDGATQKVDS
jgi:hypothetical protein